MKKVIKIGGIIITKEKTKQGEEKIQQTMRGGIADQIKKRIGFDVIVVFVIVAVVSILMVRTVVMSAKEEQLTLESELTAYQLADFFEKYTTMVEQMAVNPEITHLLKNTKTREELKTAEKYDTVFEGLKKVAGMDEENILATWIGDVSASVALQSSGFISEAGWDITSRPWYVCTALGRSVLTEPYVDVSTGELVLTAATPVYDTDGKTVIGVVGMDISLEKANVMMEEHRIGKSGFVVLLSEEGTIIYHPSKEMIQKNIWDADLSQNVLDAIESDENVFLKYKQDGKTQYGYVMNVKNTGYKVVSNLPATEYYVDLVKLIVVLVVLFAIGIVIIQVDTKRAAAKITKPIMELNRTAQKLAEGKLDVHLKIDSKDEVGELGHSINELVKRLKDYIAYIDEIAETLASIAEGKLAINLKYDYVGEFQKVKKALINISDSMNEVMLGISESAEQVSAGADDLAKASQDLAGGAGTQAAAVEELVATATSITEHVESSKKNAEDSARETMQVVEKMRESQNQMNRMMEAMDKIQQTSKEVVGIIKTIEEIADQTNLLALNASIEAARAGEAGKGFAVVAGEIGNLADQSAKAVDVTRDLIGVSLDEIAKGNTLAGEVVLSLKDSVEAVGDVNHMIQKTSEDAAYQAASIEQILEGIEEISQAVQDSSATAQESSATSEELAAQATTLNEMVHRFELKI